ncbi:MAG: TIGR00730 family Rossman fold protein [Bacteroides sp.]|nr:TIGR00730 family Rossman fold protein [Bacteroides sp.]
MKYIGVFCSASAEIDPAYYEATRKLGEWMGKEKKTLVYGGADLGLMECIAESVKTNGGRVVGVVPAILEENGRVSSFPDEIVSTQNLSDRKDYIIRESEIMVALPGGVGTLDEIFHVMAASTIGYHAKKVVLYNVNGFYNGILAFLDKLDEEHFTRKPLSNYYYVANTYGELLDLLK